VSAKAVTVAFDRSRARVEAMLGWLEGEQAAGLEHAELEARIMSDGREMLCQFFQDHLDLRAMREIRLGDVRDEKGVPRGAIEADHERTLSTVFGEVSVSRIAYRRREHPNLHPADATLNLPEERYSHGLRELAAVESTRGSFAEAKEAIERCTGTALGKRQVEELARRSAVDFEQFYATAERPAAQEDDVIVLSADGKGICMRPDALRQATAAAAAKADPKLKTRLSKGEKRARKRMAEVGAVYYVTPVARRPADILSGSHEGGKAPPAPVAEAKWLTASVVDDAASVIARVFDEAERRDPDHKRTWVAVVDGNNHQLDRIKAEAKSRGVTVTIVVDFVHVLEYLWSSAWCFFDEGAPEAEAWVQEKALAILAGESSTVAAAIRRKATCLGLDRKSRQNADECADYLIRKRRHLDYLTALANGWPIASGVIEGACRHIVKDRFDLTGARWGLEGAEAVLKLRALRSNGDFPCYWHYHLAQEHRRVHETRYSGGVIPTAA
jgi:hypothetical protein